MSQKALCSLLDMCKFIKILHLLYILEVHGSTAFGNLTDKSPNATMILLRMLSSGSVSKTVNISGRYFSQSTDDTDMYRHKLKTAASRTKSLLNCFCCGWPSFTKWPLTTIYAINGWNIPSIFVITSCVSIELLYS